MRRVIVVLVSLSTKEGVIGGARDDWGRIDGVVSFACLASESMKDMRLLVGMRANDMDLYMQPDQKTSHRLFSWSTVRDFG